MAEVWVSDVERDAWTEKHCDRCWRPEQAALRVLQRGDGCPLLARAATGRLPVQWTKRRNAVMGETYRCADFTDKPAFRRRPTSTEQSLPLFDVPENSAPALIPVEGWPDYRTEARKDRQGDHA